MSYVYEINLIIKGCDMEINIKMELYNKFIMIMRDLILIREFQRTSYGKRSGNLYKIMDKAYKSFLEELFDTFQEPWEDWIDMVEEHEEDWKHIVDEMWNIIDEVYVAKTGESYTGDDSHK